MNIQNLIANPPKFHIQNEQATSSWKLADEELLFLDKTITEGMKTIETGAGISTVVFAMKGAEHTCIVPDEKLVDRIKSFCAESNISYANINFIINSSESALPQIGDKNFQLALIDGRHGFPTPFIDWFYIANILNIGGILIIDDLHIWTCELLMQFLLSEKDWKLLEETLSAAIFIKQGDRTQYKEYGEQPFILERSRQVSLVAKLSYLVNLLKRKNFSLFLNTVSLGLESLMAGKFGDKEKR